MNKKDIVNLIKGNILNIKTLKRTHREIRVKVLLNDGDKYIFSLDKFYEPGFITPSSFLLNVYKQEVSPRTFFWGLLSKNVVNLIPVFSEGFTYGFIAPIEELFFILSHVFGVSQEFRNSN